MTFSILQCYNFFHSEWLYRRKTVVKLLVFYFVQKKKEVFPLEQKTNAFLENEKTGALMRKYAVPCVISLLVAALYNIVDHSARRWPQP